MIPPKDFEALYDEAKYRANANISGESAPILASLELDGLRREERAKRLALRYPEGSHQRVWLEAYKDPWAEYARNIAYWSRGVEAMGSEQVVRSFQSQYQRVLEESGVTPNLFPAMPPGASQRLGNGLGKAGDVVGKGIRGVKNFDGERTFGLR